MARISYQNISTNPCLNELVYSVLRSTDKDDLLKLRGKYLKAAKSEKKAKYFCANAKYDEKITLLAEFGVRFFTIFANHENITSTKIKDILQKYADDQKGLALDAISESQIFVESDKQFIHLLGLMANTSAHPSYKLNQEYQRAGYHSRKWTTSSKNKNDNNVSATIEHADYVSKLLTLGIVNAERSEILFKVTSTQLKILLYLYYNRHTFLTIERVHNFFLGNMTKATVRNALKKLKEMQYADLHLTAEPMQYSITSLGIGIVNRYMTTTFNQLQ